ncbi:hypothetical protein ACFW2X_06665 [Streptomyces antibioticus]|uniref:hypothetical protein n=1 Tax=Streptomyces antibioticus TaxID=1890 RepID=UPI0036B62F8C
MSNPIDQTRDELLAAIRKQTAAAALIEPQGGAAALRHLADAYAILTAQPLPLLDDGMPPAGTYQMSTR